MTDIFDTNVENPVFIFVDGSYYNFYRYYASLQWWKNTHPDTILEDPYQNEEFVEKFKKMHRETLEKIPAKLNLSNNDTPPIMFVAKDCKREDIWRMTLFPEYKATRDNGKDFKGGAFFKMVYEEGLFQKGGAKAILKHKNLEADDCIALSVNYILQKFVSCQIYIITSDQDYLQLVRPNVHLYNLTYKNIAENSIDPKINLETKIIMGDKSDNIPSIFPKCGKKTAQKCIEQPGFLEKKLTENKEYLKNYELNKQLIDFTNIPENLSDEFIKSIRYF
jgi:5'-3' exonuclease